MPVCLSYLKPSNALLLLLLLTCGGSHLALANEPDSVYLFAYVTVKDKGRSGLHFAWSPDGHKWTNVANEAGYVRSDYATLKHIHTPYLFPDATGTWHCVWALAETLNQFAHTSTTNFIQWSSQSYPYLQASLNFRQPVIQFDKNTRKYLISFLSGNDYYQTTTTDFKVYTPATAIAATAYHDDRVTITLPSGTYTGNQYKVPRQVIIRLTESWQVKLFKNMQNRESYPTDSGRFASLQPLTASITLQPEKRKPISDLLTGVFFEDINYSADGGLYAELLQNRDFEYHPFDKQYRDSSWNSKHSWHVTGTHLRFTIDSVTPVHSNNPHYASLEASRPGDALVNLGYDGIPLQKGDTYEFTLFTKNGDAQRKQLLIKLVNEDGTLLAQAPLTISGRQWQKQTTRLTASGSAKEARLEVQIQSTGRLMLDVLSLFPEKTFKNRKNGLRADLATVIANIHPQFIRFPGGCVAHGDGLDNMYRWKNTIGPIEARKPQPNIWRYHQTVGLGYFEYFQFCEDIGAVPLPVLPAGVPCQNSAVTTKGGGQQGGIPMNEMDAYIQEVLDLIEWANGPATSAWGKLRAQAGHPDPFNLRYIGIGNEDLISDVFEERFTLIYKALQQKHPEITVIGTVGYTHEGTDYEQGWAVADKLGVPMVDEHYYETPGWFIHNQDYYDNYARSKPHVYLGEYASRGNTLYNALIEALYLTSLERNGDVVRMASYAPLLAKEKYTQWNPDLIYFNNTEVKPTINYEIQKLYGNNAGNEYLPATIQLSSEDDAVKKRFGISVVRDSVNGHVIVKMANLLPATISVKLNLNNITTAGNATKTVLQGKPEAKQIPVQTTRIQVGHVLEETLPPYSFTVWRMN